MKLFPMQAESIKKLRDETGYPIMVCKKALEESKGNIAKAKDYLKTYYQESVMSKKGERETKNGIVASYIHTNRKVGVLVELNCETDFVADTNEFRSLANELALQIAGMNPANAKELFVQPYIRDPAKNVEGIIRQSISALGENITVGRFVRYEI